MKKFEKWLNENNLPLQNDIKHMIGNPVFAIETNLNPLRKRILNGKTDEAIEIVNEIEVALNKIKEFLMKAE